MFDVFVHFWDDRRLLWNDALKVMQPACTAFQEKCGNLGLGRSELSKIEKMLVHDRIAKGYVEYEAIPSGTPPGACADIDDLRAVARVHRVENQIVFTPSLATDIVLTHIETFEACILAGGQPEYFRTILSTRGEVPNVVKLARKNKQ